MRKARPQHLLLTCMYCMARRAGTGRRARLFWGRAKAGAVARPDGLYVGWHVRRLLHVSPFGGVLGDDHPHYPSRDAATRAGLGASPRRGTLRTWTHSGLPCCPPFFLPGGPIVAGERMPLSFIRGRRHAPPPWVRHGDFVTGGVDNAGSIAHGRRHNLHGLVRAEPLLAVAAAQPGPSSFPWGADPMRHDCLPGSNSRALCYLPQSWAWG